MWQNYATPSLNLTQEETVMNIAEATTDGTDPKTPLAVVLGFLADFGQVTMYGYMAFNLFMTLKKTFKDDKEARKKQKALIKQNKAQQFLDNAIKTLVEHGLHQKIIPDTLFRHLNELLTLLCLDACHQRVTPQLQHLVQRVIFQQMYARDTYGWQVGNFQIENKNRTHRTPGSPYSPDMWFNRIDRAALDSSAIARLNNVLLWNPDIHEVFKETEKTSSLWHPELTRRPRDSRDTDIFAAYPISPHANNLYVTNTNPRDNVSYYHSDMDVDEYCARMRATETLEAIQRNLSGATKLPPDDDGNIVYAGSSITGFHESLRQSVTDFFDKVEEIHETQKQLNTAVSQLESDGYADYSNASRKEVKALRLKLAEAVTSARHMMRTFVKDSVDKKADLVPYITVIDGPMIFGTQKRIPSSSRPLFRHQWNTAILRLGLLAGRIEARTAVEHRQEKIAELFKALGATDDMNKETQQWILAYYTATCQLWAQDDWTQKVMKPRRLFRGEWFGGRWMNPFELNEHETDDKWLKTKLHQLHQNHYDSFDSPLQTTKRTAKILMKTHEKTLTDHWAENSRRLEEMDNINTRARNHTLTGNFDAALADYKTAKEAWPENAVILGALGSFYCRLGNFDEARAELQTAEDLAAEDLAPKEPQRLLVLAHMNAKQGKNLEEAVTLTLRAMELLKKTPLTTTLRDIVCTYQTLGWSHHQLGNVPEAIQALEAANTEIENNPKPPLGTPHFYLVLGDAYWKAKRHQEAEQAWQKGWNLANTPQWIKWINRKDATPFEADEDKAHRTELAERLGIQEQENAS